MPCNSDHMEPTHYEREATHILMLLDELDSGRHVDSHKYRSGMDKRVYPNKITKATLDTLTATLCGRLSVMEPDAVASRSLELQMWWRDHQRADAAREAREREQARLTEELERKQLAVLLRKYKS